MSGRTCNDCDHCQRAYEYCLKKKQLIELDDKACGVFRDRPQYLPSYVLDRSHRPERKG